MHESRWLNLYGYPEEVDYTRGRALGPTWHNVQASVRTTEAGWHELDRVKDGDGALVYLSLGSLGSADVELMQRLIDALAPATTAWWCRWARGRMSFIWRTTWSAMSSCRRPPCCRRWTW